MRTLIPVERQKLEDHRNSDLFFHELIKFNKSQNKIIFIGQLHWLRLMVWWPVAKTKTTTLYLSRNLVYKKIHLSRVGGVIVRRT